MIKPYVPTTKGKKLTARDWPTLKDRFVQSSVSLREFCRQNQIPVSLGSRHYQREKWLEAREHFFNRVRAEKEKKVVRDWTKTWDTLNDTWDVLLKHARASLKPRIDKDGNQVPIPVESQVKLANVLDHITHNLRLMAGKSTENVEAPQAEEGILSNDIGELNRVIATEISEITRLQSLVKKQTCA